MLTALSIPREFHLPREVRGTEPVNPEGTDLYVWSYDAPGAGGRPGIYAIAFVGKQSKPLWHLRFQTEQRRQQHIDQTAQDRRQRLAAKVKEQLARKDFQHGFEVDDILYASWGYDQTQCDFFQVTDVHGKEIVVREIGQRVVSQGRASEKVMAEPGEFAGPPMRKRPQGSGYRTYVKIDSSRTAFEWDGTPQSVTAAGYGH